MHPEIFAVVESLNPDELRDPRQKPFHSLVACFKRAIIDEVLAERISRKQIKFDDFPDTLTPERNYIENYPFDLRTLAFIEDTFDALHKNQDKEWLKQINKAKQVAKDADALDDKYGSSYLLLIDRFDDAWGWAHLRLYLR